MLNFYVGMELEFYQALKAASLHITPNNPAYRNNFKYWDR